MSEIRYEERLERIRPCEHGEWNVHALEGTILNEDGSIDRDKVCRGAVRREITVDYSAAGQELDDWIPCICSEDYRERDLEDPRCRHHDAEEALPYLIAAALGRGDTR